MNEKRGKWQFRAQEPNFNQFLLISQLFLLLKYGYHFPLSFRRASPSSNQRRREQWRPPDPLQPWFPSPLAIDSTVAFAHSAARKFTSVIHPRVVWGSSAQASPTSLLLLPNCCHVICQNSRPSPVSLDSTRANRRRRIFRRHNVAAQWTRLVTAAWFRFCRSVCCRLCPTNSSSSSSLSQSGPRATVRRRPRTVFRQCDSSPPVARCGACARRGQLS